MSTGEVKGKWSTARLVIGIVAMFFCLIVLFQSCAAGISNALEANGEISGTFGFMSAICLLVAGIVGVVTRNFQKKSGSIVACVFFWIVFFFSRVGSGNYKDLRVWGFIAFVFGCVYLFASLRTKKELIIGTIVAFVYFILGII